MGLRFFTVWIVCLEMAGPALGSFGASPVFRTVSCPDEILHSLVRDFALDHELARSELLPALGNVVRNGSGVVESRWTRLPVNGTRERADYIFPLRRRILTRLNGIARDLADPKMLSMVLAVRGVPAQLEALADLQSADPATLPKPPRPRWKLRAAHLAGGGATALVSLAATSFLWQASPSVHGWTAATLGLIWSFGHCFWEHELALQDFFNPPHLHPEVPQFFLDLEKHRELVNTPTQRGDWVYSSINFVQHGLPFHVDILTHVALEEGSPKSVTWLILRRP
jgi:hypothetical protein